MASAAHSNPCAVHHQGFWQRSDERKGLRANYGHIIDSHALPMFSLLEEFSIQVRVFHMPWFLRKILFKLPLGSSLTGRSW